MFFQGLAYYLAVGGTSAHYTLAGIRGALKRKGFEVELEERSLESALISVQGPKSRKVLSRVFGKGVLKDEAFPFSTHQVLPTLDRAPVPVRLLRLSFVGEMGWELHVPKEEALALYGKVMAAGEEFGIRNAGYRAMDSLSIEKGPSPVSTQLFH